MTTRIALSLSHKATTAGVTVGTLFRPCSPGTRPSSLLQLPRIASTSISRSRGFCRRSDGYYTGVGDGVRSMSTLPGTVTARTALPLLLLRGPGSRRTFTDLSASKGKSEADLIVEEIEEHYFTTKDELEIATDSTNQSTIYAPSDRESAREALNRLTSIYTLYTSPELSSPAIHQEQQEQPIPLRHGEDTGFPTGSETGYDESRLHVHGQGKVHGQGRGQQGQKVQGADADEEKAERAGRALDVETDYDPTKVSPEVRREVRKRVERGVKEMEAAVEALEERASSE